MRHQRKRLKDHADFFAADLAQTRIAHRHHIFAVDQHLPAARLNQAVEQANQRRFARTGQAHHHKNLAFVNFQIHISHRHRAAGFGKYFLFRHTLIVQLERSLGMRAENLVKMLNRKLGWIGLFSHFNLLAG